MSLVSLSVPPPSLAPMALPALPVTTTAHAVALAVALPQQAAAPHIPPQIPPPPTAPTQTEAGQPPYLGLSLHQSPLQSGAAALSTPHHQQQLTATGSVQQPLPFPPLTPAQVLHMHPAPAPRLPLPGQGAAWASTPPGGMYMPPTPGWFPSAPYQPVPPAPPPHAAQQMSYTAGDEHLRITPEREARPTFNIHIWIRAVEDALRRRGLLQEPARAALWVTGLLDVATNVYMAVAAKPCDAPELTSWPALKAFLTTCLDRSGSHAQAQRALTAWTLFKAGSLTNYDITFTQLVARLPQRSDLDVLQSYLAGLPPDLCYTLTTIARPSTATEAMAKLREYLDTALPGHNIMGVREGPSGQPVLATAQAHLHPATPYTSQLRSVGRAARFNTLGRGPTRTSPYARPPAAGLQPFPLSNVICRGCRQPGHLRRNCPVERTQPQAPSSPGSPGRAFQHQQATAPLPARAPPSQLSPARPHRPMPQQQQPRPAPVRLQHTGPTAGLHLALAQPATDEDAGSGLEDPALSSGEQPASYPTATFVLDPQQADAAAGDLYGDMPEPSLWQDYPDEYSGPSPVVDDAGNEYFFCATLTPRPTLSNINAPTAPPATAPAPGHPKVGPALTVPVTWIGPAGSTTLTALLDTGAQVSAVAQHVDLSHIGGRPATSSTITLQGSTTTAPAQCPFVSLTDNSCTVMVDSAPTTLSGVAVAPLPPSIDMILGTDWLTANDITIDVAKGRMHIGSVATISLVVPHTPPSVLTHMLSLAMHSLVSDSPSTLTSVGPLDYIDHGTPVAPWHQERIRAAAAAASPCRENAAAQQHDHSATATEPLTPARLAPMRSTQATDFIAPAQPLAEAIDGEVLRATTFPDWPDKRPLHPPGEFERLVAAATATAQGTQDQVRRLRALIHEYADVFPPEPDTSRPLQAPPHAIHLTSSAPIRFKGYRRYPQEALAFLDTEIPRLQRLGVIRPSTSPYDSALVFVRKPDGSFRMCHDYRQLNAATVPLDCIMPHIDATIDELGSAVVLSKLDMSSGYFQLRLEDTSTPLTAFSTHLGKYEYTRCPFGLRNLPAAFNIAITTIFADLRAWLQAYFDDLIAHSTSPEQHLHHLKQLFQRCREANVFLSLKKCCFMAAKADVLGFTIIRQQLAVPDRAKALINTMHPPTTPKQLLSFLGLLNYYRRFCPRFTTTAQPLLDLARPGTPWRWTATENAAFETLKELFRNPPLLRLPRRAGEPGFRPFVLETDASAYAIGAVLSQAGTDDQIHPVSFLSRKLRAAEINYSVTEKEALALVYAVHHFRFLLMTAPFTVHLDHKPLQYLLATAEPAGRLARWIALLQQYTFTIVYRPGADNGNADAFSRLDFEPTLDEPLRGCDPAAIPTEADSSSGRRPAQTQRRTAPTVLALPAITRAMARLQAADAMHPASYSEDRDHQAAHADRPLQTSISTSATPTPPIPTQAADPAPVPPQQAPLTRSPSPTSAQQITQGPTRPIDLPRNVWHVDPWLSTALHTVLRGDHLPSSLPARVRRQVERDAAIYSAHFEPTPFGVPTPVAIFARRQQSERQPTITWEVPPPSRRLQLVAAAHHLGHFGVAKTTARLDDQGVWWPGRDEDVHAVVMRCAACQRDNAHRIVTHPAIAIPIPHKPFDRVHVDLLALPTAEPPLPPYSYLLLFVDGLSKFPVGFPLVTKEAEAMGQAFWSLIATFGPPAVLVSDNGTEFTNSLISSLCATHGIHRRLTASYHPQSNGQVERVNRTITAVLRKVTADTPGLWPLWLDYTLMAIRTAVHASTGRSPFELLFGRQCNPLADYQSLLVDWASPTDPSMVLVDQLAAITRLTRQRTDWQQVAVRTATTAQVAQRLSQDASHAVTQLRLKHGDVVFLRQMTPSHKLDHRFIGPFTVCRDVLSKSGPSANYIIADDKGRELRKSFPRDQLFHVAERTVPPSLRQAACYDDKEWEQILTTLTDPQPGPLPAGFLMGGEETTHAPQSQQEPTQAPQSQQPESATHAQSQGQTFAVESMVGERTDELGRRWVNLKWVGYAQPEWTLEIDVEPQALAALKADYRAALKTSKGRGRLERVQQDRVQLRE